MSADHGHDSHGGGHGSEGGSWWSNLLNMPGQVLGKCFGKVASVASQVTSSVHQILCAHAIIPGGGGGGGHAAAHGHH